MRIIQILSQLSVELAWEAIEHLGEARAKAAEEALTWRVD